MLITFMAVVVAWVFFRAESFAGAMNVLQGMSGVNGFYLNAEWLYQLGSLGVYLQELGIVFAPMAINFNKFWIMSILLVWFIAWFMPNTQQLLSRYEPAIYSGEIKGWKCLQWQPSRVWTLSIAMLATIGILSLTRISEFLYFNF
jgi:hypothetical protein